MSSGPNLAPLVDEILDRCGSLFHSPSPSLVLFLLRSTMLSDPTHYPPGLRLTPEAIQRLIDHVVQRVTALDDPELETIKMQLAFDTINKDEIRDRENDAEVKREKKKKFNKNLKKS